jgi:hypothetical protein
MTEIGDPGKSFVKQKNLKGKGKVDVETPEPMKYYNEYKNACDIFNR